MDRRMTDRNDYALLATGLGGTGDTTSLLNAFASEAQRFCEWARNPSGDDAGAREAQNSLVSASSEAAKHVKSLAADVAASLSIAGKSTAETITAGAREAQNNLVSASSKAAERWCPGGCWPTSRVLFPRGPSRSRPRAPRCSWCAEARGSRCSRCRSPNIPR